MERIDRLWGLVAEVARTAESADGVVVATCSAYGELLELDLDPAFRDHHQDDLADDIRDAVRDAAGSAARRGGDIVAGLLPPWSRHGDLDLVLDPLLLALDRIVNAEPSHDDHDTRPRLGPGVDYRVARRKLALLRDRRVDLRTTETSADRLVSATVDGRGRLVDLWLHENVRRARDPRALADRIRSTVRAAVATASDQQRNLRRNVWR